MATELHCHSLNQLREMLKTRPLKIVLKINFNDGCQCEHTSIEFPVNFQAQMERVPTIDQNSVIQKLRDTATQDHCCGQFSVVHREIQSPAKKEITVYAVLTNMVDYDSSLPSSLLSEINLETKCKLVKRHEDLTAAEVPLKKLRAY